jgi:hypothetical protein
MKKMDFSCFLVLKTGKLSNLTLDNFRWDSPIFPKNTGLGLLKYIIATGGQIVLENSALKVKKNQKQY